VNGVQLELVGKGWLAPFMGLDDGRYMQKCRGNYVCRGCIAGLTLMTGTVYGTCLSPVLAVNHDLKGVQVAPVNYTIYTAQGFVFGMFNYSADLKGLQIGLSNGTDTIEGLQMAVYNRCGTLTGGIQVGLFNKADEGCGVQIGLLNKIGKRVIPLINWQRRHQKI